jgi:hypothetical protein
MLTCHAPDVPEDGAEAPGSPLQACDADYPVA